MRMVEPTAEETQLQEHKLAMLELLRGGHTRWQAEIVLAGMTALHGKAVLPEKLVQRLTALHGESVLDVAL